MNYKILAGIALFFSFQSFAQEKYTLSGTVKEKTTGETIIGATIKLSDSSGIGVITNEYGFYSITLPAKNYTILFTSVGFETQLIQISLNQNKTIDVLLIEPKTTEIEEVVVNSRKKDDNVTNALGGVEKLDVKEIAKIPVFAGEKDIIKTLQLTPGIKSGGDGNAGMYVRGGAADQNLILLDEAPVYNASHLLGFFSTFNSDAIKDVTVYKGGMPSQYGGRLSSVLDVKMNDGNVNKYHFGGGLGIISSRLFFEGPIVKEKGSFLITARRTYADMFLKATENYKDASLYFYDLNLKANYRINAKNRIFLSGYFGQDKLGIDGFGLNWGNGTGTIRWNSIVGPKLFSNTTLTFSNFNYNIGIESGSTDFEVKSKIRDYNIKQDFTYTINPKNSLKFGINSIQHTVTPGQISSESNEQSFVKLQDRFAWENAAYFSHEYKSGGRLNVVYGIRFSTFTILGEGDFYSFNDKGEVVSTTSYKKNEAVKTYLNLEPRFSTSYTLNNDNSLKFGYARNVQNLHLISNSTASTPTDLWIMSSENVKPEISDQLSFGYYQNFKNNNYEFSSEIYYKSMQNQIDYRDGANTLANDKIEGELLFGKGRAYGLELYLKKKTGKFNGWISYTLARTEKLIDGINKNEWYAARQDKTHDVSIVGIYDFNKKWSLSASWVFTTGNAVTFPTGKYTVDGNTQYVYTERNGYRMPNYHRMDVGVTWYKKKTEKFESSWNFSVYNAYGRQNAWTINFRQNESNPSQTEAVQIALFRWVPSVTYNFKF